MERNVNYFAVGLALIAGMLGIVLFSLWVLGKTQHQEVERYTIYFTDAVSGLKEGSPVEYKGVRVGKVVSAALTPNQPDVISVVIEIDANTPICAKTQASLGMMGITGLSRIDLITPAGELTPPPHPEGEAYPVLYGDGTKISKIFEDIPQILANLLKLTDRLEQALDEEAADSLKATMLNLERLSRDFHGLLSEKNVANASKTLENTAHASGDFRSISKRFADTAAEVDKLAATIAEVISGNQAHLQRLTSEGVSQIILLSQETQEMAESIRKLADKLAEDPSQIIYKPKDDGVVIAP